MNEFKVGQQVWFVLMNAARSSKIHQSDNGLYLVNIPAGFTWLLEEEIFHSREALAKHLFPELFESPWKKTSEELPPTCTYVIAKFRLIGTVEYNIEQIYFVEGYWYNRFGRNPGIVDHWMYIPE